MPLSTAFATFRFWSSSSYSCFEFPCMFVSFLCSGIFDARKSEVDSS